MQTREIQASILGRIGTTITDMAREFFPENPEKYQLTHPKGAFLISYVGGAFGPSMDDAVIVQERKVRVVITTLYLQLNGRDGILDRLDQLRAALVGFTPTHCNKLAVVDEKFIRQEKGLWSYATVFEATTLQVEDVTFDTETPATAIVFEGL